MIRSGTALLREALLAGAYDLGDAQAALVLDALEVAAEERRYRAGQACGDCYRAHDGRCESHAADVERAGEYDELAAEIRDALTSATQPAPEGNAAA